VNQLNESSRLSKAVATRLARALEGVSLGGALGPEISDLLDVLELFVPLLLRDEFPEWDRESLDGFMVADARKEQDGVVRIVALAILISDQCVTPFDAVLGVADGCTLTLCEVRLGERGGGALGISGPVCTSSVVAGLVESLISRIPLIEWVYGVTYPSP
jgi:hypothetical protein